MKWHVREDVWNENVIGIPQDAQLFYYIKPFEHSILMKGQACNLGDSQTTNDFIVERRVPSKRPQANAFHRATERNTGSG